MFFSQTTEYALRAVVTLASTPQHSLTTAEIAELTQVPAQYLSKVLQILTKAGVVRAQRGLRGGFSLSRAPEQMSVLEVVNAVEPLQRIHQCPLGLPEHTHLCPLHQQIDDAVAHVECQLASKSIADMIDPLFAAWKEKPIDVRDREKREKKNTKP